MAIQSFRDLIVWQRALQMSVAIYELTENFPSTERFGLIDQMRRASISVLSNIAEGRHRGSKKDFIRFLYIAYASHMEIQAQMCLAKELPHTKNCDFTKVENLLQEIGKMLNSMIGNMKRNQAVYKS